MRTIVNILTCVAVFSLSFGWGIGICRLSPGNDRYTAQISHVQALSSSQTEDKDSEPGLVLRSDAPSLVIDGRSAFSVYLDPSGKQTILFAKEKDKAFPIASLTKLMTAAVVLEKLDLARTVEFSQTALVPNPEKTDFKAGEKFFSRDLLVPLLVESNNDSANALAEATGYNWFIDYMNFKGLEIGLKNTFFVNPSGLDTLTAEVNYSTAQDVADLTAYLLDKPGVWNIISLPAADIYSANGVFHHRVISTNEFLTIRNPEWKTRMIGAKTGWTDDARGCLVLVLQPANREGYVISVILGANDRFGEMEKMINWIEQNYSWPR